MNIIRTKEDESRNNDLLLLALATTDGDRKIYGRQKTQKALENKRKSRNMEVSENTNMKSPRQTRSRNGDSQINSPLGLNSSPLFLSAQRIFTAAL